MLYKSDFTYLSRYTKANKFNPSPKPKNAKKRLKFNRDSSKAVGSFLKTYFIRSTLHGVRYLVESDMTIFERLIWIIILSLSITAAAYTCILSANRFYSSPLQTVVESTMFPTYNIYYPAVTICNHNRVDWTKMPAAKKKFIPNATKEVEELFESFVAKLEVLEWANFENYEPLRNVSLKPLDHINFSELNDYFTHPCEEIFDTECWFRYKFFPCCEIFVKQKSEYGFCYAFNSVVNDVGLEKWLANDADWPVKTSTFGIWSGLKLILTARFSSKVPGSKNPVGIMVIVHYPFAWPNSARFVPAGSSAAVVLRPKLSYAVHNTRRFDPISRDCVFANEAKDPKYMNLPGLDYHMTNCISACRQRYMVAKCNCSLEAFFPLGNYEPCKISDVHCLLDNNDFFNYETHVKVDSEILGANHSSMFCPCIHECSALDYQAEIVPMPLAKENYTDEMIILDIHFQHGTLIKYRTEVVYEWLDLLVSFGGMAGLFMGASVLSGVELVYYLTIGMLVHIRNEFKKAKPAKTTPIVQVYPKQLHRGFSEKF